MPQVCQICNHPNRLEIDRELVEGKSKASISRKFGVSQDSLANHANKHLSRQLTKAYEQRDMAENMDLMNRIDRMINNAETIFQRNFDKKKDWMALQALNSQKGIIELLAKISAYLHQSRAMELETSQREDNEEMRLAVGKLELCELELLGKIQDKLAGKIKWERLLPDEFYRGEKDFINIHVNVETDNEDLAHERIVVRPDDQGGATSIKTASLVDGFVDVGDVTDIDEKEPAELAEPADSKPTMTRGTSPTFAKITYGPSLPLAQRKRIARRYVKEHGRMPRESWLRDAL